MEDDKESKYAYMAFKSVPLGRTLDRLRDLFIQESEPDYLVIPYVLTCSAYLEAKLNDALLEANERFGDDVSAALLSSSLSNKLRMLVPILTDGVYEINKESSVYRRLISLIRVRNTITHAKSELREYKLSDLDDAQNLLRAMGHFVVPEEFRRESSDVTLGASKTFSPLEYHDALDKLDRWFFRRYPDRLSKVSMVVARKEGSEWEEVSHTFVKDIN